MAIAPLIKLIDSVDGRLKDMEDDSRKRTDAEEELGIIPDNYAYIPGDVRRYGPALDGSTDDTTALTTWASVGGDDMYFPANKIALITAAIPLVSNSTIRFGRGGRIQTATTNISMFSASAKTNIRIFGGHFKQTSAGNNGSVAHVRLVNCTNCWIDGVEFEGHQWAAVELNGTDDSDVTNCYCHDALASTAGNKFDIQLYHSNRCNVAFNRCYGAKHGGIIVQDVNGSGVDVPTRNRVHHNRVRDMEVYGIVIYLGGSDPTFNEVTDNEVENVDGDPAAQDSTGTGIYAVGSGIGGLKICRNTVRNACILTDDITNGPAGITIADVATGTVRPVVSENNVEDMTQGSGILLVSSPGGAIITSNSIRMPSNNDGSGAGGGTLVGNGIKIFNSSDATIEGNGVIQDGSGDGLLVIATTSSFDRITINGNTIRAAEGNAVRVDRTSTHVHTDIAITGNNLRTDDAASCVAMAGCDRVTVTGNVGGSDTGPALAFTACTATRVANNSLNANGTNGVTTSGTCTNSNYDKTNRIPGNISNGGTGFRIEQIGATPAAGTYVAGDTVWHAAPAAGASPGAICTTGGTPGTWKAMPAIAA
jgi:hypothetical protein